jgi:hypothetical protein
MPELPALVEIAPGVFKHQALLTRADYEGALAMARQRADQASFDYTAALLQAPFEVPEKP